MLMSFSRRRLLLTALPGLVLFSDRVAAGTDVPVIAVASNMRFVAARIARAFRSETGRDLRLVFGSSGKFAQQIRAGAPFEMFMSANEGYVSDLHEDGYAPDAGSLYARGRLVEIAPEGGSLAPDGRLDNLAAMLRAGTLSRFAIANPDHAPYGMRAREALKNKGIWSDLQPYLVLGENVAQAAQFAVSGNAEGGIIAWSLALAPDLEGRARFAPIPEGWHRPLRQRMVLLDGAGPVAKAFCEFVQSPPARRIIAGHGFGLPEG